MGSWTDAQAASVFASLYRVLSSWLSPCCDPFTASAGLPRSLLTLGSPSKPPGLAWSAPGGRGRGQRPRCRQRARVLVLTQSQAQGRIPQTLPVHGSLRQGLCLPGELFCNQREMGQIIATLNKAKLMLPARPSTGDFLSFDGRQRGAPDGTRNPSAVTTSLVTPGKSLPISEPQFPNLLNKGPNGTKSMKRSWHSALHVVGTR